MSARSFALGVGLCASVALAQGGSYTPYGQGCPGGFGTPYLAAFGSPQIGGQLVIQTTNLTPSQAAVLFFGASNSTWSGQPLPIDLASIGMPGCQLLASAEGPVAANTGGGVYAQTFTLPLDANLIGKSIYNQFAALDPSATTPVKIIVSNGAQLTFGAACTDGALNSVGGTFSVLIPPIPNIGNPSINLSGNYGGQSQQRCCGGPTNPANGCWFNASAAVNGQSGPFTVNVPASISQQIIAAACAEVQRYVTVVSCTGSFPTMSAAGMNATGTLGAAQDQCAGSFQWIGNGQLTFGAVTASPTVTFKINIVIVTISFDVDLDIAATPTGSFAIQNNQLTASASVPSVTASKTFTIPILNQQVTFSYTLPTPTLSGTTAPATLPPLNISCN